MSGPLQLLEEIAVYQLRAHPTGHYKRGGNVI